MGELAFVGLGALAGKVAYDIVGPLVKEVGDMLKEEVQPYRAPRRRQLLEKTAQKLQQAEIKVHTVPGRILFPILEYSSVEDDDYVHDKWATLLAQAANSNRKESIPPAFPTILRELSPMEVFFLDTLLQELIRQLKGKDLRKVGPLFPIAPVDIERIVLARFPNTTDYDVAMQHLGNRGLTAYGKVAEFKHLFYHITGLGLEFILACQDPVKRE